MSSFKNKINLSTKNIILVASLFLITLSIGLFFALGKTANADETETTTSSFAKIVTAQASKITDSEDSQLILSVIGRENDDELVWQVIGPYEADIECTAETFENADNQASIQTTSIPKFNKDDQGKNFCVQVSDTEAVITTGEIPIYPKTIAQLYGDATVGKVTDAGFDKNVIILLFSLSVGASVALVGIWYNIVRYRQHVEEIE